jgi:hypothetical protein
VHKYRYTRVGVQELDQLVAMPQDAPLGAELLVAGMMYKAHPKFYNAAGKFSAKGKTAARKCLKISACTSCKYKEHAADKVLWYDHIQFASFNDLRKFKKIKLAAQTAAGAFITDLSSGTPKEAKVDIQCATCGERGGSAYPKMIARSEVFQLAVKTYKPI